MEWDSKQVEEEKDQAKINEANKLASELEQLKSQRKWNKKKEWKMWQKENKLKAKNKFAADGTFIDKVMAEREQTS